MKIRGELHLGSVISKVILVQKAEETFDHLALKLAAYAMFHDFRPVVEPSSDHPALDRFEHKPDVMILGPGGDIVTWIECGTVSTNKLDKVLRRLSQVRAERIRTFSMPASSIASDWIAVSTSPDRASNFLLSPGW